LVWMRVIRRNGQYDESPRAAVPPANNRFSKK
jgi:hypothetical protein